MRGRAFPLLSKRLRITARRLMETPKLPWTAPLAVKGVQSSQTTPWSRLARHPTGVPASLTTSPVFTAIDRSWDSRCLATAGREAVAGDDDVETKAEVKTAMMTTAKSK